MIAKSILNKFTRLSEGISNAKLDIIFLKRCKKSMVFPNFINVKVAVNNSRSEKVLKFAKIQWLNLEIKFKYGLLSDIELELYNLHLKITKYLNDEEFKWWLEYTLKIKNKVALFEELKKAKLQNKFEKLISKSEPKVSNYKDPLYVENFVCNLSEVVFTEEEIQLLNKGLNFAVKPGKPQLLDTIVDIETMLKQKLPQTQNRVREVVKPILMSAKENTRNCIASNNNIIKRLKEKDVYYMKADKGNSLVILDKKDYDERMIELINNGSYKMESKSPLTKMEKSATEVIDKVSKTFGLRLKWSLKMNNPSVPKLYGLPKLHKLGKMMRSIVSNLFAPT